MSVKELQVLKEEEKTLINLHTKLSDQLNRLKVEELALITMIRLETGGNTSTETGLSASNQDVSLKEKENMQQELQLSVTPGHMMESGGMEEEEEEEMDEDSEDDGGKQLMSFLEELSANQTL